MLKNEVSSLEILIKMGLSVFVFLTMAVIGGLSIQGGDRLQTEYPGMFDYLGGWWIIHFFVGSYLILWLCITVWIFFIGREKQIYEKIKGLIKNARTS